MLYSFLVVDDDAAIRQTVGQYFSRQGHRVLMAGTGAEAMKVFSENIPENVLLDVRLPDASGLDLLQKMRAKLPESVYIVLTGHADVETAVSAMKNGAATFLTKPVNFKAIDAAFEKARQEAGLRQENNYLRRSVIGDLDVNPPQLPPSVMKSLAKIAPSDVPVLLLGATGTGKGTLAKYIHQSSPRRERPFMEINCANLSKDFLEAELFGHERGAFTDAKERKKGLMEIANDGTLFLDEIAEAPVAAQAKLLTAIETQEFRRMGGVENIKVNTRIITATNGDPARLIADGRFREDLFYRINVFSFTLPPLAERKGDILPLAGRFLKEFSLTFQKKMKGFSPEAEATLREYAWPGNIRELRNWMERAVLLCDGDAIKAEDFPRPKSCATPLGEASPSALANMPLSEAAALHVRRVLEAAGGNQGRAAEILGISRPTLRSYLRKGK